jgi:hypothetical protein
MACRSILNRILEAAEGERLIPINPVRKVRAPKRPVDPEVVFGRVRRRAFTRRSSAASWPGARPSTAATSSSRSAPACAAGSCSACGHAASTRPPAASRWSRSATTPAALGRATRTDPRAMPASADWHLRCTAVLGRLRVERRTSGEASSVWQECNGEKGTELERARACPRACGLGFSSAPRTAVDWGRRFRATAVLWGGPVRCAAICRTGQVPRCAPRSPTKPRATEKSVRKSRPGGVPPAGRQRRNRYPAPPRREREAVPAPGGGWGPGGRRPTSAPPIDLLLPDSLGRRGAPSPGSARRVPWGRTG